MIFHERIIPASKWKSNESTNAAKSDGKIKAKLRICLMEFYLGIKKKKNKYIAFVSKARAHRNTRRAAAAAAGAADELG